jgi:hypothetical protein
MLYIENIQTQYNGYFQALHCLYCVGVETATFRAIINTNRRPMWLSGGNTRLIRKRSRVRFNSANICVHEHMFVLGLGVSMYNMYVFTEKMY